MKKLTSIILTVAFLAFGYSCEPADDHPESSESKKADDIFAELAPKTQHFSIDPARSTAITTANGVEFTILPSAFITTDQKEVSGPIDITIKEVFTIPEMIFSGVLPVSYDRNGSPLYPIESDGQFFFEAKQKGTEAKLEVVRGRVFVSVPIRSNNPNMRLYKADQSIDADSVLWQRDTTNAIFTDSSMTDTTNRDSMQRSFHQFSLSQFSWINCDALFFSDLTPTKVSLTYRSELRLDNIQGYLVFRENNSVMMFYNQLFNTSQTLLIYGYKDDKLYYDLQEISPPISSEILVDFKSTSKSELEDIINDL